MLVDKLDTRNYKNKIAVAILIC